VKKQKSGIKISIIVAGLIGFGSPATVSALVGNGGYDAAIFQADYIQDLSDFTSGIVNPALLFRVNQMRLEAGIYRWNFTDPSRLGYQELSFLYPFRLKHTFGITVLGTGSSIDETKMEEQNSSQITVTGRRLNYGDAWYILHYSWKFKPWLALGTNVKVRDVGQFGQGDAWGVGADIGFYFNPVDHFRYGDFGLSVNFQDIVPTQVKWEDASEAHSEVGVTRFRAGIRYSGLNNKLIIGTEAVVDNALGNLWSWALDSAEIMDNGVKKLPPIAYRGSFHIKWQFIPQIWLKTGWSNNNIPYIGFNCNGIYLLPEMINYGNLDFHIGYSVSESERGATIMTRLSTDFGPTREQKDSKKMYDLLILAPMDAYNEAMRLYLAGKYWEASFAFGKVMSLYPNFYLNDKAAFYMGNSYRFLQMHGIARQVYKNALEEYSTSDMRPKYLYGLENIDYRENKYEDALRNHAFIINLYGESEIRPDADYLAGEIHFLRKNFASAEQLLSTIKRSDPSYFYAQYTLSIINFGNKKIEASIENLKHIIKDTTQDPSTLLLQDAANTKLGHIYFEQVDLRNAVEAYKRVPEGSSYGDEALLGTAWAWIKGNQPAMSNQTVDRLVAAHTESPLISEAYLVKGYGLMLQKNYGEAIPALEKCLELAKGAFVTDEDLAVKAKGFKQIEHEFEPSAEKIRKNALRKPTDKTLEEREAFKTEFDKFAKESRDFFNYQLLAKSHKRFFMRKDELVQDAEYALAKSSNIIKNQKQTDILEKSKQKEQTIDQEIDKLKQKLETENKK
jgi:tetratricopeptide (TPR) repeat protein